MSSSIKGPEGSPYIPPSSTQPPVRSTEESHSPTLDELLELFCKVFGPKEGPKKFKELVLDPLANTLQVMAESPVLDPELQKQLRNIHLPQR